MGITLKNRREAYENIKPKRDNRKAMILEVLQSGDPGGDGSRSVKSAAAFAARFSGPP